MIYQIQNSQLEVALSDDGAEMVSIKKDGQEYLWNGDSKYWTEHAPLLFPFVGRFTDGKYRLGETEYEMSIHGFAKLRTFEATAEDARVVFELRDDADTYRQYPFHFILRVVYELCENEIRISYEVVNTSDERMYFGIGGHPGFSLPFEEGLAFADYYLEFAGKCRPFRVGHTEDCFLSGIDTEYPLEDGRRLHLKHNLFDDDAVVLKDVADAVTLKSDKGTRSVMVSYPDLPFLGIWHRPKTDAPYVCIEPWVSLPSRKGIVEDFRYKNDLVRLDAGKVYRNAWSIRVE